MNSFDNLPAKPTPRTAKAINAALSGHYEFYPNEQMSEAKTKRKHKIAKTLCPCSQAEMEYTGQTVDQKDVGVYRCKKHLTWKRFPHKP